MGSIWVMDNRRWVSSVVQIWLYWLYEVPTSG
jgi:hypothetical protein